MQSDNHIKPKRGRRENGDLYKFGNWLGKSGEKVLLVETDAQGI